MVEEHLGLSVVEVSQYLNILLILQQYVLTIDLVYPYLNMKNSIFYGKLFFFSCYFPGSLELFFNITGWCRLFIKWHVADVSIDID